MKNQIPQNQTKGNFMIYVHVFYRLSEGYDVQTEGSYGMQEADIHVKHIASGGLWESRRDKRVFIPPAAIYRIEMTDDEKPDHE